MYLKILCLYILTVWNAPNSFCRFTVIDTILQKYKQTTLPLREDEYQNNEPIFKSYDYVIVGASPAGCVLANRLTEDPRTSVLLLEAGPEPHVFNEVPAFHLNMFNTDYNWKFSSQYNPRVCRAMEKETCPWPSGKGIGGGTNLNALLYTRGNKQDFDGWAANGNEGWSYKDVLKYFKKTENLKIPELRGSPDRGKEGPLSISYSPFRSNASLAFIEAGKELGYPIIDYNTPYQSGFAKMQLTMKEGYRSNAHNSYLKPISKRSNLHVAQRSFVFKIIIDPNTMTATGVEFYKNDKRRRVSARKEVILSAGGFGSPKLLMLSGIGPKEHLESLNIKVLRDLPVGNNLQEHVGVNSLSFLADGSNGFLYDFNKLFLNLPISLIRFQNTRDGPPSSVGVDSIAYVSSRYSTDANPDIELLFVGLTYSSAIGYWVWKTTGIREDVYNSYFKALEGRLGFSIWIMGCYPKSRGTVRLSSANPFDDPVIVNNFFNDTEDINVIIDGIKKAVELTQTKVFRAHGAKIYKRNQPGCEGMEFSSDKYWDCIVRQITTQYHHQCGTCKMGPVRDPSSVVDPRLRVHGVRRLRVADASIIPTIPAGHTQAPSYMIGEKAADMIKEDNL